MGECCQTANRLLHDAKPDDSSVRVSLQCRAICQSCLGDEESGASGENLDGTPPRARGQRQDVSDVVFVAARCEPQQDTPSLRSQHLPHWRL
jgi:hypothetical protein